jgi:hypothetical protein
MQALNAWLGTPADGRAAAAWAVLNKHSAAIAPPLGKALGGVKLKKNQRSGLQELRNLFVCVRSEAARYGPDRCGESRSFLFSTWHPGSLHSVPGCVGVESWDLVLRSITCRQNKQES